MALALPRLSPTRMLIALLHHALTVFFAVLRAAAASGDDVDVIEVQVDQALVQVGNAGVAHGGEDAARLGSLAKAVLTSGEWAMA